MKTLVLKDTRRIPANGNQVEMELRLIAAGAGMAYDAVLDLPREETEDFGYELAEQFRNKGEARKDEDGNWRVTLAKPIAAKSAITVREPTNRELAELAAPELQGYARSHRIVTMLADLTPSQADEMGLGDVAMILNLLFPQARGGLFR